MRETIPSVFSNSVIKRSTFLVPFAFSSTSLHPLTRQSDIAFATRGCVFINAVLHFSNFNQCQCAVRPAQNLARIRVAPEHSGFSVIHIHLSGDVRACGLIEKRHVVNERTASGAFEQLVDVRPLLHSQVAPFHFYLGHIIADHGTDHISFHVSCRIDQSRSICVVKRRFGECNPGNRHQCVNSQTLHPPS